MTETMTYRIPVDISGRHEILVEWNPRDRRVAVAVPEEISANPRFRKNLADILHVDVNGLLVDIKPSIKNGWEYDASTLLPTGEKDPILQLFLGHTLLRALGLGNETISVVKDPGNDLCVFETRTLGAHHNPQHIPLKANKTNFSPTTDLHTHLSGELEPEVLIKLGLKRKADSVPTVLAYPIRLLERIGLKEGSDYSASDAVEIPFKAFAPHQTASMKDVPTTERAIPLDKLPEETIHAIQEVMAFPSDRQSIYGDMENVFMFREPFTKDTALLEDTLRAVAKQYRDHGVKYAELSSTEVLNPKWLETIHRVLPEIEKETGVSLRFLAGIPRNLHELQMKDKIAMLLKLAPSPYIVGVDFLGYEVNKTESFGSSIRDIAQWADDHDMDFVIRVHAGENRKNFDNIKDALRIASDYKNVQVRIGHGVFGLDEETLSLAERLAKQGRVGIELNPDSNLALNGIDFPEALPIIEYTRRGIPIYIGSDGTGIYRTSPAELSRVLSAAASGEMIPTEMMRSELDYIQRARRIFIQQEEAFPSDFFKTFEHPELCFTPEKRALVQELSAARAKQLHLQLALHDIEHDPEKVHDVLDQKTPLLIVGASGTHFGYISADQKENIMATLSALSESLDPEQACVVGGRAKKTGLQRRLSDALDGTGIDQIGLLIQGPQAQRKIESGTFTHILMEDAPLYEVSPRLIQLIKQHEGAVLFIGGGAFTRDAILVADREGVPFAVMKGPEGASTEKAAIVAPKHICENAEQVLQWLAATKPELLKKEVREKYMGDENPYPRYVLSNPTAARVP